MKRLLFIGIIFTLFTVNANAVCTGTFLNPITDVKWKCMFPISLGGISTPELPFPEGAAADIVDKISGAISPLCTCFDPLPRAGLTFAMNNIFRIIEATKDPLCFPSLGLQIGASQYGAGGADGGVKNSSQTTFNYIHMIAFVPTQVLNIFIDVLCLQLSEVYSPFTMLSLSEFEPWARSSEIALIMAPESILFANPVAQAYCMVDAALTIFEQTDPFGYWCAGGHSIFPLSNHSVESTEYVDASSINAAKVLFKLARTGQLLTCLGSQALCSCMPNPIWNKREFRLQLAKPMTSNFCFRIGKPSLLWNAPNRSPALINGADNLAFMVWRRRDCCVL